MKPFDIYTFDFPGVGAHPAVILGTAHRVGNEPFINVLLCTSQRATRPAKPDEVLLNGADGLDWETLCKCDLIYVAEKSRVQKKRGEVSGGRRRLIAERVIRGLGIAGI